MSGSRAANQEVPAGQARRADADEVRVTELPATGASGHQGAPTSSWIVEQNCRLFRLPLLRRLGIELPARSAFPPPAVLGALSFGAPTQPTGGRAHMPLRMR